jgi:hypothetical protein
MMPGSDSERFSPRLLAPRLLARIVGILGVAGILTGAFDIGYVQSKLIVAGNASATLHNILAHQTLFRVGFSAHLFELLLNILAEIISFYLFRRVNVLVAAVSLCAGMVGIAVEAVALLIAYVPLQLAVAGSALGGFTPEQLHAFASFSMQWKQAALLLSWAFYGLDELAGGFLIFRSRFLPRVLGILLAIAGLCYFTSGFLSFLAPSLHARLYSFLSFACLPGEALTSLWMATVGLNVAKWKAWTTEPQSEVSV